MQQLDAFMDDTAPADARDSGLACLVLVARLHALPAEAAQIRHQFCEAGRPIDSVDLIRAARWLGLEARAIASDWSRLRRTPLPAIARQRDGRYVVIARVSAGGRVLIHDPIGRQPTALAREAFEERWSGELLLLARRERLPGARRGFGFAWFVPAILKYRCYLAEVLLASFVIQIFALVTPLIFQVIIDKVLVHRGLRTLDVLGIGLLIVSVFEVLLGALRTYVFAHTGSRIDVTLGAQLFRHLLRLPLAYFEARRVGDTVARVRELETVRNFLTGSSVTLLIDSLFTVVFFAVMYVYSPLLTLIVLAAVPCYGALALAVTPWLRARLHEKFDRGADSQAFLVEAVSGIATIKAGAVEPQMCRRWEDKLAGYVRAGFRASQLANLASQSASFINKITILLILWLGARLVIDGRLSVGQLVAFNMLAARVSAPVLRLTQLWQDFQQAAISVQRLGDILDAHPEPAHSPSRGALPRLKGGVAFEHVGFRYGPDAPEVLHDVSFAVLPGEVIGIVGPSGSGKSTLARLIQRLHVPSRGRVLVDGIDLAMVDPAWLRRNIGVVLQENFLFNRSIRDNIALADAALPMERVVRAARLAGAHDFILELPEGYDTIAGEHGGRLSGGQRQRIAIARALIGDPRVLILDEATSALDCESEAVIHRNMRYICKGRTALVIAHRLSAVRHADRILVIERGRIVEQGGHRELVERGGYYARLRAHQETAG
jgi:subfamily B ATP-binding cassette protein HlyB/CyaB